MSNLIEIKKEEFSRKFNTQQEAAYYLDVTKQAIAKAIKNKEECKGFKVIVLLEKTGGIKNKGKTDFTLLYSDLILRDIVKNISKHEKAKIKAEQVRSDNAIHSVTTQRHWQAAAKSEHLYKEIVKGYNQMKELDDLTSWSSKLIQERFSFLDKYPEVMKRYEEFYKE